MKAVSQIVIVCYLLMVSYATSETDEAVLVPGQTHSNDPNGCFWFRAPNRTRVFKCCPGYFRNHSAPLSDNCIECPEGSYGNYCLQKCECQNGKCNKVNGSCQCLENYFGKTCNFSCNCANAGSCLPDGSCSCRFGFFGKLCEHKCMCPFVNGCPEDESVCVCPDNYNKNGTTCLPCSCSDKGRCDTSGRQCQCRQGYYGDLCERQCPCHNGATCVGADSDTCKCENGWTGSDCTVCDTDIINPNGRSFCHDKCLNCYNGHTCNISSTDCECTPGWQGNRCNETCDDGFFGKNCLERCYCVNGRCDHVTGVCNCDKGWNGDHCDEICPENCVTCKGTICTSCKAGWNGVNCSIQCKAGFYGYGCRYICPKCHCTDTCNHINGNCFSTVRCSQHNCVCKNAQMCIEYSFQCECSDGWSGTRCEKETTTTINDHYILTDIKKPTTAAKGKTYLMNGQIHAQNDEKGTRSFAEDKHVVSPAILLVSFACLAPIVFAMICYAIGNYFGKTKGDKFKTYKALKV